MADLLYPVSLPCPTEWEQQRLERRQMRDLREPANANLLRSRGLGLNVRAAWVYESQYMATWRAWFEGPLAAQASRLRFWSAPLPGRGGFLSRVARYMEPPQRDYLGMGVWRVSAPLYVRGLSVAVQEDATVAGDTGGFELREDGDNELREDGDDELRG